MNTGVPTHNKSVNFFEEVGGKGYVTKVSDSVQYIWVHEQNEIT